MGKSLLSPIRLIVSSSLLVLVWGTPSPAEEPSDWKGRLRSDLEFLASEDLRGRSAVDETIELAAEHIAERFRDIGLQTELFDQTPYQPVEVPVGAQPGDGANNRVEVVIAGSEDSAVAGTGEPERWARQAALGEDFMPLAIGVGEGTFTGELAFVGYGITAPELGYDDYEGIDARGKGVLVLRKEPGNLDPESPFDGTKTTRHAYFATKIANAIEHGAAAVLIVNDPASRDAAVESVEQRMAAERQRRERTQTQREELPDEAVRTRESLAERLRGIETSLEGLAAERQSAERGLLGISDAGQRPAETTTIPVLSVARDTVDQWLRRAADKNLESLEEAIDASYRPASFALPKTTIELEVSLKPTSAVSNNVLATLPGKGRLADETVVIGAHYDHVGMGGYGSLAPGTIAVHHGADDNASGTATLLAAAQRLAAELEKVAEHRRLVFIAFTAEERGLLGSKRYIRSPRFPLESTVAMINLDMVGRLRDNELTVYGTGTGEGLESLVERVNETTGFDLHKIATGYGPSDHQSFYEAGVPVLFFFTGLHADYHRPSDKSDKIDFGGMTRITDMVCGVAMQLAIRAERPAYANTDRRFRIRRQLTAFLGVTLSDQGDHVVISSTVPEGPAEAGGLRAGDRLERLGERRVRRASDVLEALRERSPGDTLSVQFERAGSASEVKVQLQERP